MKTKNQNVSNPFLENTVVNDVVRREGRMSTGRLNSGTIGVGLEVEAEGQTRMDDLMTKINSIRGNDQRCYWSIKRDGSLRNGGIEFVSSILYTDGDLIAALNQINDIINEVGSNPRYNHRCSLHVHMDVRTLTLRELLSVILVYTSVEPLLINYCGEDRAANFYCLPYSHSDTFVEAISRAMQSTSTHIFRDSLFNFQKYSALNIKPVFSQGSIEFRTHPGTHNFNEIYFWVTLLKRIWQYGKEHTTESLPEFVSGIGIDEYIVAVLGNDSTTTLLYNGYQQDVLNNIRIVQNMMRMDKTIQASKNRVVQLAHRFAKRGWTPNKYLNEWANRQKVNLTNSPNIQELLERYTKSSNQGSLQNIRGRGTLRRARVAHNNIDPRRAAEENVERMRRELLNGGLGLRTGEETETQPQTTTQWFTVSEVPEWLNIRNEEEPEQEDNGDEVEEDFDTDEIDELDQEEPEPDFGLHVPPRQTENW